MKILFPLNTSQRYYKIHYQYVLDLFRFEDADITFEKLDSDNETSFYFYIDNKKVIMDFSDSGESVTLSTCPCFKFHFKHHHLYQKNCYPFAPVSFYLDDWQNVNDENYNYQCNSDIILCNQRPYGNATQRRKMVHEMLRNKYGDNVDTSLTDQRTFWNKINNCLCAVCVPGFCNNMIDRGFLQYLRFGCCCISPKLPEIFPAVGQLIPGLHYIQCADDYSDLFYAIEFVKSNRDRTRFIGRHAKEFTETIIHPKYLVEWIGKILK